ncbi:MAG: hypothetical protein HZA32_16685 [Opitutae bacterium]|nr:hypothetical protein [Opitutae bacterium]
MESPYHYRAFGLNVLSDFEVPFWGPGSAPWDARIVRGIVPAEPPAGEDLWHGVFRGGVGRGWFNFPGVMRVIVEAGERIVVEPAPDANPAWLTNALAGTVSSALLYQRGGLCLHASAVSWQGRAYLVMGPSGAGKSTTASALLARGCEFISDDITVVTAGANGEFFATASFPAMRLREDSHDELGDELDATRVFDASDDKFRLNYGGAVATRPVPIARICFLERDETLRLPRRTPLTGHERVSALQRSFFRRRMAKIVTDPVRLATVSIALAQAVDVVRLSRPVDGFALDELCQLVLE